MATQPTIQSEDPRTSLTIPLTVPKVPGKAPVYLALVLAAMLLGTLSVVLISVFRPGQDNADLYVVTLGFISSTLASASAFIKSQEAVQAVGSTSERLQEVHLSINSRFDKFADEIRVSAHAEGVKEAEDKQKDVDILKLNKEKEEATAANLLEASKAHADTSVPPVAVAAPPPS